MEGKVSKEGVILHRAMNFLPTIFILSETSLYVRIIESISLDVIGRRE